MIRSLSSSWGVGLRCGTLREEWVGVSWERESCAVPWEEGGGGASREGGGGASREGECVALLKEGPGIA
jgi:hypothetical protein